MRTFLLAAAVLAAAVASGGEPEWTAEIAPFESIVSRLPELGRTLRNEMLARMIVSASQAYFARTFGNFRVGDPIRFAAYPFDGPEGSGTEVAIVYPSVDKAAKLLLHHPGSERLPSGNISLPLEKLYAVFSRDGDYCAFAPSEATAVGAASAKIAPCPEGAIASLAWKGGSVSLFMDGDGLYTKSTGDNAATAPFAAEVPWLSIFTAGGGGGTHRIVFDDLKKLVVELVRQMKLFRQGEQ